MPTGLPQTLPITEGGTGAKTAAAARTALGLTNITSGTNSLVIDQAAGDTTLSFPDTDVKTYVFPEGTCYVGGLIVKPSTGDPANPWAGLWCHNTTDNTLKLYTGTAWLTVAYT